MARSAHRRRASHRADDVARARARLRPDARARVAELAALGLQPATHAIGDAGNRMVLDAYADVARADDSIEMHGYDTVKGSDFLADQDVIEYFVEQAPKELALLENWGCPWSRNDDGTVSTRAFGGMTTKRKHGCA